MLNEVVSYIEQCLEPFVRSHLNPLINLPAPAVVLFLPHPHHPFDTVPFSSSNVFSTFLLLSLSALSFYVPLAVLRGPYHEIHGPSFAIMDPSLYTLSHPLGECARGRARFCSSLATLSSLLHRLRYTESRPASLLGYDLLRV